MRSFVFCLTLLFSAFTSCVAQGPPLNATPEQLFEAGMNALSGSASTRENFSAVEYFRRSAQKGHAPAQVVLGYFYDTGAIVAQDSREAADWYKKAAEQGDPLGQWLVGRLYFSGSGLPRDYAFAEKWLTAAANQNNPFGAYLLGLVMAERDYTKAPRWFQMAAEQGLPQAQYRYAQLLKDGRGVAQDRALAYVLVSDRVGRRL
jgi:TPR repeat protein